MRRHPSPWFTGLAVVAATVVAAGVRVASAPTSPTSLDRRTAEHVLNRVTFGPRPGDVDRLQAVGLEAFLDAQLHPDRIDDSAVDDRLAAFTTLTMSSQDLAREYFQPAAEARRAQAARQATPASTPTAAGGSETMAGADEAMTPADRRGAAAATSTPEARQALAGQRTVINELMQARLIRATLSERQLQEVLVDFWFNHFNVFVGKGQVRQYLTEYERDAIRPHVLGRFRDLLGAVAHSPAMLFYLDNWQSSAPTPSLPPELLDRLNDPRLTPQQRQRLTQRVQQRRPQQARGQRGLNENYARELMELHTLGVDGGYSQQDVVELARILTGWTIDQPRSGGSFIFRAAMHDTGTKTFLGETFGSAGPVEGEHALDLLARHPSTAHHIAYKLAQRFIADAPPAAAVDRAARVFTETDGDLREVVRSLLTAPEFLAPTAWRAKVKTPIEFVVSSVRATDAAIATVQPLVVALQNLGMPLYGSQPPTGYSATADAWVNTGALLNRMNFATALIEDGRITPIASAGRGAAAAAARRDAPARPGAARRLPAAGRDRAIRSPLDVDLRALAPDTSEASQARVVDVLLGGDASDTTRQTLARAGTPEVLVALALGSPEFQRR